MISALIITIIALFGFLGSVVSDAALPALQEAKDTVVAALTDVEETDTNGNDQDGDGDSDSDGNSEGDENENGDTNGDDNDVNGEEGGENGNVAAKTTKVEAYNLAAGFVMPTLIPQVAVDNSSNLVSCDHPEADCEDSHPGNSDKSKNNNGNSANGNAASHKKS